jgi:hypothetical protein
MMRPLPQRFLSPAPVGTLFKRAEGIARTMSRGALPDEEDYLKLVRALPCLKCAMEPAGEAAHVRLNSGVFNKRQAMAKKPDPKWTLPLCSGCHWRDRGALHRSGEYLFWQDVGLNPLLVCDRLYAARGDVPRMRAIALVAIAERGR